MSSFHATREERSAPSWFFLTSPPPPTLCTLRFSSCVDQPFGGVSASASRRSVCAALTRTQVRFSFFEWWPVHGVKMSRAHEAHQIEGVQQIRVKVDERDQFVRLVRPRFNNARTSCTTRTTPGTCRASVQSPGSDHGHGHALGVAAHKEFSAAQAQGEDHGLGEKEVDLFREHSRHPVDFDCFESLHHQLFWYQQTSSILFSDISRTPPSPRLMRTIVPQRSMRPPVWRVLEIFETKM